MQKETKSDKPEYESVKIAKSVVDLVRDNKKKTYMPIGIFFEQAAIEKLKKAKK
jgi:hypothetical protein